MMAEIIALQRAFPLVIANHDEPHEPHGPHRPHGHYRPHGSHGPNIPFEHLGPGLFKRTVILMKLMDWFVILLKPH